MADPGFPVGGGGVDPLGAGMDPDMGAFQKNVCKKESIGFCRGGMHPVYQEFYNRCEIIPGVYFC